MWLLILHALTTSLSNLLPSSHLIRYCRFCFLLNLFKLAKVARSAPYLKVYVNLIIKWLQDHKVWCTLHTFTYQRYLEFLSTVCMDPTGKIVSVENKCANWHVGWSWTKYSLNKNVFLKAWERDILAYFNVRCIVCFEARYYKYWFIKLYLLSTYDTLH